MINFFLSKLNFLYKFHYSLNFHKSVRIEYWRIRFSDFKNITFKVGEGSYVSSDITFEKDKSKLIIGSNTFISGAKFSIAKKIIIGNNVQIAFGTLFFDHNSHSLNSKFRRKDLPNRFKSQKDWSDVKLEELIIEDDVWIGANSIILKGVKLKQGTIIAAGSVVIKSTEPFSLYAGNPAKFIKKLEYD